MENKIIDGKQLSLETRRKLKEDTIKFKEENGFLPHLCVVIVGDDPASKSYVKAKEKACSFVGFKSSMYKEDENITQEELLNLINKLNNDDDIHGILVQLPLPKHIDSSLIINSIKLCKDVDGFHTLNVGNLQLGNDHIPPCTPKGVITMLKSKNIEIEGKHAVVIGRSNIVGKPMAQLLLNENATVTIVHSRTKNIANLTKQADILIAAVGRPNTVTKDMVKEGAVVIDIGVNRVDKKLVGDVDFNNVIDKVKYITPVPGGVGPMTIATLMQNTMLCATKKIRK